LDLARAVREPPLLHEITAYFRHPENQPGWGVPGSARLGGECPAPGVPGFDSNRVFWGYIRKRAAVMKFVGSESCLEVEADVDRAGIGHAGREEQVGL